MKTSISLNIALKHICTTTIIGALLAFSAQASLSGQQHYPPSPPPDYIPVLPAELLEEFESYTFREPSVAETPGVLEASYHLEKGLIKYNHLSL